MENPKSSLIPCQNAIHKHELIVHYKINFKNVCLFAVSIPLGALVVCVLSALIFQFDDVHETHCRVFNIVPSISAVTGVSPQRYIWRISVALHIGPRITLAAVYNSYQLGIVDPLSKNKTRAQLWLNVAYFLNLIEAAALCGVAYISNRENYPIHEKLFIIFMVSSLTHMLACIQGTKLAAGTRDDLDFETIKASLKFKKDMLVLSLLCTAGLVIFFLQHRFFCIRLAFSMFALFEYIIAAANMAFHISTIKDFPTEDFVVGKFIVPNPVSSNKNCAGDIEVATREKHD
ncbi:unnamed protein product [Ceutorhynchus assimilis]|uniref:CWH43-like N-terminal domain-containing protein n=1 Tax=Ceutorhynchus assimilis TaxID=467358 RepID=A0A9N9QHK2_9CUCU|nr:unnamed protein product [Ceutorhynchus assimilis]